MSKPNAQGRGQRRGAKILRESGYLRDNAASAFKESGTGISNLDMTTVAAQEKLTKLLLKMPDGLG